MAHHHDHDHAHGHSHGHIDADADRRWLWTALALIGGFMLVEVVAGLIADSLALLSDAAHMLTDAGALGLALVAAGLAARPARGAFTFGLGRAEILSAQINGAALLVLAGVLAISAIRRLEDPPDVEGAVVLVVGAAGAVVNIAAAWALSRAERRSLNIEGARAHVLADLFGSIAALAAGAIILLTGWRLADPIAALMVVALMLRSGWSLLRDSARVLLEGAPQGIDPDAVGRALASRPGIVEVHDLHLWEVTTGFPALAAHVVVAPDEDCHARRRELQSLLGERLRDPARDAAGRPRDGPREAAADRLGQPAPRLTARLRGQDPRVRVANGSGPMRHRHLHAALASFAEEAAWQLASVIADGVEVPFEVVEARGRRRDTPLYCYQPLTQRFVTERVGILTRLPAYPAAAQALSREDCVGDYLRAQGETRVPVEPRARADAALRVFVSRIFSDASEFVLTPGALRSRLARSSRAPCTPAAPRR